MKYVLLGTLSDKWASKHTARTRAARDKLSNLSIKLDAVYYTQGEYDFVDVVDAPNSEAVLAFSVWYTQQGYGRIRSLPAFDTRSMTRAMKKV